MSRYLGNARREIFSYRAAPDDTKQKIIENNINNLLALAPKIDEIVDDTNQKETLHGLKAEIRGYKECTSSEYFGHST
jgi:hypothetical protein